SSIRTGSRGPAGRSGSPPPTTTRGDAMTIPVHTGSGHLRTRAAVPAAAAVVAFALGACAAPPPPASALEPIDRAALQAMVDTTIEELRVPGAVVRLHTPQGEFTVVSGTTELGMQD